MLEEITTDTANPQLATPQVTRTYSYGHDLISQDRFDGATWTLSFYGYDGHGNKRSFSFAHVHCMATTRSSIASRSSPPSSNLAPG